MKFFLFLIILITFLAVSCIGEKLSSNEIGSDCTTKICMENSNCTIENDMAVCKCNEGYELKNDKCINPDNLEIHHLFVTGETKTEIENDDGYTQRGIQRAYKEDNDLIIDSNTGLYWQNNDNVSVKTWEEGKNYCKNLNLGINKWRLPSYEELLTLIDLKFIPTVNPIFSHISQGKYWTDIEGDFSYSYYIDFSNGETGNSIKSESYNIICVTGDFKFSRNSFLNNENETYTDETTGLTWIENLEQKNWENAVKYCENLDFADYSDWHLPNINELYTLIYSSVIEPFGFWSSTTSFNDNQSRVFDIVGRKSYSVDKNELLQVICVRGDNFASYDKGKWGEIILNNRYVIPKDVTFIDIRTQSERDGGWPENSVFGATYSSDKDKFISDISNIVNNDKSKHIILICASSEHSSHAVEILSNAGFTYIEHIIGGTNKWKSYNLPWVTE